MTDPKLRRLSNVEVTAERVSLRVDGQPMEAIRVKMGVNHVWRIRFPDERLSHQTFANADRAVRWIASGMPVAADQDSTAPPDAALVKTATPTWKGKGKGAQPPPDQEPDPEWQPLDWVPRTRYVPPPTDANWTQLAWESRDEKLPAEALAAVPGAPKLLDPTAIVRAPAGAPGHVAAAGPAARAVRANTAAAADPSQPQGKPAGPRSR